MNETDQLLMGAVLASLLSVVRYVVEELGCVTQVRDALQLARHRVDDNPQDVNARVVQAYLEGVCAGGTVKK